MGDKTCPFLNTGCLHEDCGLWAKVPVKEAGKPGMLEGCAYKVAVMLMQLILVKIGSLGTMVQLRGSPFMRGDPGKQ